jgi:hypothetical protein
MASVRLDAESEAALNRLAARRGQTKSEVIRDAVALLVEAECGHPSAYDRLRPFVGVADSGGRELSTATGRRLREILEDKARARRAR